jgi:hypothetical protein
MGCGKNGKHKVGTMAKYTAKKKAKKTVTHKAKRKKYTAKKKK